jgi:hypothetical protein
LASHTQTSPRLRASPTMLDLIGETLLGSRQATFSIWRMRRDRRVADGKGNRCRRTLCYTDLALNIR